MTAKRLPAGLDIINPLNLKGWDDWVLSSERHTFFHSAAWAKVLYESYKYKPLYFIKTNNGKLTFLLPVMEVKSFLTGNRGVSLPFTDHCPPLVAHKEILKTTQKALIQYGKRAGWKYFELRGWNDCLPKQPASSYFIHSLDLTRGEEQIFSNFRNSTKRNIKRALKENFQVALFNNWESVKAFYRLHCITRKSHGLPPQPLNYFKNVFEYVISANKGFVVLASIQNHVIAGAIYFHFGTNAIFKYGASDRSYQHLRPNNLVMWKAIQWYVRNGFKSLSFGRTEPEHRGLLQFKRGWRGEEKIINYYRYHLKNRNFIRNNSRYSSMTGFFKLTPSPILKLAGHFLYRHVG